MSSIMFIITDCIIEWVYLTNFLVKYYHYTNFWIHITFHSINLQEWLSWMYVYLLFCIFFIYNHRDQEPWRWQLSHARGPKFLKIHFKKMYSKFNDTCIFIRRWKWLKNSIFFLISWKIIAPIRVLNELIECGIIFLTTFIPKHFFQIRLRFRDTWFYFWNFGALP